MRLARGASETATGAAAKSVERVYSRVPFYRKKLDEAGVTPDSITR